MTQTADRRILVYTEGMFNVYNGHQFEQLACDLTYTLPLGMHNRCTTYEDKNGLLWAKDFYRLYLIDTRTYRFCHDIKARFSAAQINEPLNDFILDKDKQAWLITESGKLYRYDWKSKARLIYTPTTEENRHGIQPKEVIQAGPFHLLLMNNGRIYFWEEKTSRIIGCDNKLTTSQPSEYFRVVSLELDTQHLLIAVGYPQEAVYSYNIYTREWKEVLRNHIINDLKKDQSGNIWLGGNQALIQLSSQLNIISKTDLFSLLNHAPFTDYILSILVDNQQGLWLGTGSSGILKSISEEKFLKCYSHETNKQNSKLIRTLTPYDTDNLLAGTMNGIYFFNTREKHYSPSYDEFNGIHCTDIKKDRSGHFWISSRQGFYCLNGSQITRYGKNDIQGLSSDVVRFCLPLSDGTVFICHELKDLIIYDPESQHSFSLNQQFPRLNRSRAFSFALEIQNGDILIGGQNGIYLYQPHLKQLNDIDWIVPWEKFSNKYNCAYRDHRQQIWVGTQNGLLCHNPATQETLRFSTEEGLPNNCIQGITADKHGDIWISTSHGIGKIHQDEHKEYFITGLNENDGIPDGEMMEQAMAAMPDGHIYIGGVTGITDVTPQITHHSRNKFPPMLVGLRVMDQTINNEGMFHERQILPEGMSHTRRIALKHNENFIEFRLSALNYETPQQTHYRYKLKGVDIDWNYNLSPSGVCTASYTSLSPGTYTLQAQSSTGYNNWSEVAEWQLAIAPPLWKTWWAYTLYAFLVLGVVYFIIELYITDKRSRLIAEQENIKRQKEQHLDELKFKFFTNISHEFRTPLALIITPLELLIKQTENTGLKKELEKILYNAKDLLSLVNQLLDFRKLEQQGEQLKLSVVSLKTYLEHCIFPFNDLAREKHIDLVCECAFTQEDAFMLDAEKINRVLNNLLSNALKFTPHGGFVHVQASWVEDLAHTPEKYKSA